MIDRKSQVPLLKVLVVLFSVSILLIIFTIYLFMASDIPQRDPSFKQQLLYSTMMSQNCFLLQDGKTFNRSSFTQNTIDQCIPSQRQDSELRLSLLDDQKQIIKGPLYTTGESSFSTKEQFCGSSSSQKCSPNVVIPLRDGDFEQYYINLRIITQK